ncbi:hypothetical protein FPQ18DRAFT_389582 [Pyronema domesticum]|nr:hypothetical protein FPQ18DRAFT_389582 [Pyronema domesticum]
MKTWTITAVAISLVSLVSATPLVEKRQAQTSTPVTGASTGGVQQRLSIQNLQANQDVFNMYILGLDAMQRMPETNCLSYYQIAGIHGRPYIPWQSAVTAQQDNTVGYCTHSSALFVTWHRPYIALIEQRVVAMAVEEAAKFSGADRKRYAAAAQKVRLPYWDWAAEDTRSAIPAVMMQPNIQVSRPNPRTGVAQRVTIRNPLFAYNFSNQQLQRQYFQGFFQTTPRTLRSPISPRADNNAASDATMRIQYPARRQNTYNLFSIPTFREFSSTAFSPGGQPNAWTSVESIHNQIHAALGGRGVTPGSAGHMSTVDYSAFDPIFWLHHVQVDRLSAMYQATHPGQVVTPQNATPVFARRVNAQTMDTIDTPLWPFRKANRQYYTSRDVSTAGSIWGLGYAYPEVPVSYQNSPQEDLASFVTSRINALYSPASSPAAPGARALVPGVNAVERQEYSVQYQTQAAKKPDNAFSAIAAPGNGKTSREWLCHFVFTPAEIGAGASPQLDVYFANASNATTRATDAVASLIENPAFNRTSGDYYVGSGAGIGKLEYTEADRNMKITATVPLNQALTDMNIDPNNVAACVKYLADNLVWRIMSDGGGVVDLAKVPSLKVGVSSAEVTYGAAHELPKWGKWETYYEVTEKKSCGLMTGDSALLGSASAPRYLGRNGGGGGN